MCGKPRYAQIELPQHFEKGDCHNCPCSYSEIDGFDGVDTRCVFYCRADECPLIMEEEK